MDLTPFVRVFFNRSRSTTNSHAMYEINTENGGLREADVRGLYTDTFLEFIISIVFLGFMGDTSRKRTKEAD